MATRRNISACRCLAFSSPISTMPSRLPVQSANWSSPCQCCTSFAVFPRGNYQIYNGRHSEHKVWAPRKVKGWKLYELVEAKGQIGYIGGRRLTGAFVVKDVRSGKVLAEVTPRKLVRLARCVQGWIITRFPCSHIIGKEGGASSPS